MLLLWVVTTLLSLAGLLLGQAPDIATCNIGGFSVVVARFTCGPKQRVFRTTVAIRSGHRPRSNPLQNRISSFILPHDDDQHQRPCPCRPWP